MPATIHIPDAYLDSKLGALETNTLKCMLIDISTYNRATDSTSAHLTEVSGTGYTAGGCAVTCTVTPDTTNHKTVIVFTPAGWAGATTISATGAAIIDTNDGNKIVAVDDFGATVASSGGTYSVAAITHEFTHF
jgi:hypothetical protein